MLGLGLASPATAQNMCPNPSFESGAWAQANSGSADYLTASNVFGVQTPRTGTYMMGEAFGNQGQSNFREYIKCTLTSNMVIGNSYYLEMWVSLSDQYGTYACNRHGMALTTTDPYYSFSTGPIPLTPQVQSLTPLTSQTTWMQVSGTISATQAFRYLTIGNFYNDASTTFQFVGGNSFTYGYYFMDDILVQPTVILAPDFLSFSAQEEGQTAVRLDWSVPATTEGQLFEVQRSIDGGEFTNVNTLRLADHPDGDFTFVDTEAPFNVPLSYRILQNDANGNIHYSEVKQLQLMADGVGKVVGLYPTLVSSQQPLQLEYLMRAERGPVHVEIVDATGKRHFKHQFEAQGGRNLFWIVPGDLATGSYILQVDAEGQRSHARFQVTQ